MNQESDGIVSEHDEKIKLLQEVKALQEQLQSCIEEQSKMLEIITHDMKNPLSSIRFLSRILKEEHGANTEINQIGIEIESMTKRMFDFMESLVKAHHLDSEKKVFRLDRYDVSFLAEGMLNHYEKAAERKQITFKKEFEAEQGFVIVDQSAFLQILDVLISNAVKYSPLGAIVTVKVVQDAAVTRIGISDEGPGLSLADKPRLFEKFVRLSPRATGGEHSTRLGLYIAKKLTEAMQGRIWCESEEGKGSTFFVELPAFQTVAAEIPE